MSDAHGARENAVQEIQPAGPLHAEVRPPGSKSITNRALVAAALATGTSRLSGVLDSEDTQVMIDSLARLGVATERRPGQELVVHGCGGTLPVTSADLFVGNSGTTVRFLTALVATATGRFRLDGIERMRQRPIGDLLDALGQWGASAVSEAGTGCPPVLVQGTGLPGGQTRVRGDISSQFLSGLLLAGPNARSDVEVLVDGPLVSQPYVQMTIRVMEAFGIHVEVDGLSRFRIAAPQPYRAADYWIEPDASAASYWWGAAAITGGTVTVLGLTRHSLQGDVAFCDCLAQMGCTVVERESGIAVTGGTLRGITVDMNSISDTVQTLAAVALFAEGPTTITGVAHIRHKETDRIGDLIRELQRLGARVDELPDGLRIHPGRLNPATIETYGDHRMAMSLALVGLRQPGVAIRNPSCVGKTYPGFFSELALVQRPS